MNREIIVAWAAGIFEGEGSFQVHKGKAKGITLSSTDLDVLTRLKENFNGCIYEITKRKEHWKDAWLWSVQGIEAENFYNTIEPYLLSRRKQRGLEWISMRPKPNKLIESISDLYSKGYTHQKIADIVGLERSSVSKYIKRHKMVF